MEMLAISLDMEARAGGPVLLTVEGKQGCLCPGESVLWASPASPSSSTSCLRSLGQGHGARASGSAACVFMCVILHPLPLHLPRGVTDSNRVAVTDAVGILSLG